MSGNNQPAPIPQELQLTADRSQAFLEALARFDDEFVALLEEERCKRGSLPRGKS